MASRIAVFLAPGCEELEAITVIDLCRRADIEVVTLGLDSGPVIAARGTALLADASADTAANHSWDAVVLPGGLPGADHLAADPRVLQCVHQTLQHGGRVAAICAAPKVLAQEGLLNGRRASCYPGTLVAEQWPEITVCDEAVVLDGPVLTSRGPGTAMRFALALVEILEGPVVRDRVENALVG